MNRFIILLLFFFSIKAGATHWLTYYVYVETEYVQGPWARTNLLARSDYKYLAPKVYEDLFGTMKEELAEKFMARLREEKPAVYDWDFEISLQGDTVCLEIQGSIDQQETVVNEVTATMILNSFDAVCFKDPGGAATYSLTDITLPLFDLVSLKKEEPPVMEDVMTQDEPGNEMTQNDIQDDETSESKSPLLIWFILSVVLNLILVTWIIFRPGK